MLISIRSRLRNTLLLIVLAFVEGCGEKPSSRRENITPPSAQFSTGDIAFRLGRTLQSGLIASTGDDTTRYSHIGIILVCDGECRVVHIEPTDDNLPDEICCEPVEAFFSSEVATTGCVMRYAALTPSLHSIIEAKTRDYLNSKILFDHDYLLSDNAAMYCTELVENIYLAADISLSEHRRHTLPLVVEPLIMPSDIAQNSALRVLWRFNYDDLRPAR